MRKREWIYEICYHYLDDNGKKVGYLQMGLECGVNEEEIVKKLEDTLNILLYPFYPEVKSVKVKRVERKEVYSEILPTVNRDEIQDEEFFLRNFISG